MLSLCTPNVYLPPFQIYDKDPKSILKALWPWPSLFGIVCYPVAHIPTSIQNVNILASATLDTNTHTHTTVLLLFWNLSGTTRVSRYQKGKTNLDLLEQEIVSGSGICWAICKSAPHPRQPRQHPTTRVFYRLDALPAAQPTASKHWRQFGHKK